MVSGFARGFFGGRRTWHTVDYLPNDVLAWARLTPRELEGLSIHVTREDMLALHFFLARHATDRARACMILEESEDPS